MSVSLMMGWALLAGMLALVLLLVVVLLITGLSGKRARGRHSPEQETGQGMPVNVFQHQLTAPAPPLAPAPAAAPAQWSAPVGAPPVPGPAGPWAAPRMGGAADLRRWHPGIGAAGTPMDEG